MKIIISQLICPGCGNKFPIPRRNGSMREKGHRKWIYCPYCKEMQNMLEIREFDFEEEVLSHEDRDGGDCE